MGGMGRDGQSTAVQVAAAPSPALDRLQQPVGARVVSAAGAGAFLAGYGCLRPTNGKPSCVSRVRKLSAWRLKRQGDDIASIMPGSITFAAPSSKRTSLSPARRWNSLAGLRFKTGTNQNAIEDRRLQTAPATPPATAWTPCKRRYAQVARLPDRQGVDWPRLSTTADPRTNDRDHPARAVRAPGRLIRDQPAIEVFRAPRAQH